ncbi:MAG: DUF2871 domain-containing protein [Corynebacterium sp.]|uniref:DUF2871 domain-containing protein n=1 Tax=Corynebacterium sp. TaxID=1720 RepID=UPI0026E0962D|nr:DUF2871 domain-containing protein [Corynebacterium sp.]MDO5668569.1 DUF2871 domain-containing protein [Corynebacterium sp.]
MIDVKTLYNLALTWLILGLVAGVFYREWTKFAGFTGDTQLSTLHTHMLTLGVIVHLVLLALDRGFALTGHKLFTTSIWVFNAGLAVTMVLMTVRGLLQVDGGEPLIPDAAISGMAGLGHITMAVGLGMIFKVLGDRVKFVARQSSPADMSSSK